jgi:ribosomal protein S18 acetylase RimI-like enzyme
MPAPAPRPPSQGAIHIRPATEADAEAIARTLEAAFAPLAALYTPAAYAATVPPVLVIRSRLAVSSTWVAEQGHAVLGTVTARAMPAGVHVQSMAVLEAARGQGGGSRLLEEAVGFAVAQGARRMFLSTTPFLQPAIRLYRQCGFHEVPAEGPFDLHGTPLVTMQRLFVP